MSISPLSESTTQVLSSSQVLTDPISLIKELVENALDANASAISIEISSNALDSIQVKDNGLGIIQADRALLAQRHHTSKIRSLEDLSKIGGKYLGFRGVALANAAEMSEAIVVCTHTDSELIGETLRLDKTTKVLSRQHKSLPVGTTVRAEHFLKFIPVRRQAILKNAASVLARIKPLLLSYALARPNVRFSTRILKDPNHKANWTHGSKKGATILDTAMQLFGTPLVSQCTLKLWNESLGFLGDQKSMQENSEHYAFTALLPKAHFDAGVVSHIGQHVLVDSRPVSSKRGTFKKLIEIFKAHLQRPSVANERLANPFIYINISCPQGSYDVNVEPAKDDVLFNNESKLFACAEHFFTAIYGSQQSYDSEDAKTVVSQPFRSPVNVEQGGDATRKRNKETTLRSKRIIGTRNAEQTIKQYLELIDSDSLSSSSQAELTTSPVNRVCGSPLREFNWDCKPPMGRVRSTKDKDFENERFEARLGSQDEISDSESDMAQENFPLNPWILAKMNAPIQRKQPQRNDLDSADFNGQLLTPRRSGDPSSSPIKPVPARPVLGDRPINQLPSPEKDPVYPHALEPSHLKPWLPKADRCFASPSNKIRIQSNRARLGPSERSPPASQALVTGNHRRTLDTWVQHSGKSSETHLRGLEVPSAGLSLGNIPTASQRSRHVPYGRQRTQLQRPQKPFLSPLPERLHYQGSQLPAKVANSVKSSESTPSRRQAVNLSPVVQTQTKDRSLSQPIQKIAHHLRLPQPPPASIPFHGHRALQYPMRSTPHNVWIGQEPSMNNSPVDATQPLLGSRSLSRSFSPPDQTSPIQVASMMLKSSTIAIAAQVVKMTEHDFYIQHGKSFHGFEEGVLFMPSIETVDKWQHKTRQLIAALSGNGTLEGELNLRQAFKEWSRSL